MLVVELVLVSCLSLHEHPWPLIGNDLVHHHWKRLWTYWKHHWFHPKILAVELLNDCNDDDVALSDDAGGDQHYFLTRPKIHEHCHG